MAIALQDDQLGLLFIFGLVTAYAYAMTESMIAAVLSWLAVLAMRPLGRQDTPTAA